MVAAIIDGTAIAKGIRQKLNASIGEKQKVNPRYKPSLVIIQGTSSPHHFSPGLSC
jgi:methylenetetrahydrofolate dehydrogenase (NADP+)/methenyltetrahydrofolate cyclohydrolase/formyltetrahydrofolate synthetase